MYNLSPQRRKVIASIARENEPLRVRDITRVARIGQQNRTSAVVCRLKNEGYLTRNGDGRYEITDPGLRNHIRMGSRMEEYLHSTIVN